ncbi:MucBP domain-containing protein [Levilactobacillus spicheri]|uniref:MucBP domain-containing protein n=2 Tax=Levilactobacillus spicheri TaxID=216463 RepID=A0ABQ0WQN9_9LACO|nr:MucBP domain-containing protein [Levilactobacillus spicheri]KRL48665.1 hypothetical protein FD37_GL001125 [Levilactobacillus spicheri DSM 15429]GEO67174.1 hypothetical protein LSP04_15930 [Levilactobacillus spicheri]
MKGTGIRILMTVSVGLLGIGGLAPARAATTAVQRRAMPTVTLATATTTTQRPILEQWPQTLSTQQLNTPATMDKLSERLPSTIDDGLLQRVLTTPLPATTSELLATFVTQQATAMGKTTTTSQLRRELVTQSYLNAWLLSRVSRYQAGALSFSDLQQAYRAQVRPRLGTVYQVQPVAQKTLVARYDQMFASEVTFTGLAVPNLYEPLVERYGVTTQSVRQLAAIDPAKTAQRVQTQLNAPLASYLTTTRQGTTLAGTVTMALAVLRGAVAAPVPPVTNLGQLTARYVTAQGKALATVTRTGLVGQAVTPPLKTFTGYRLQQTTGQRTSRLTAAPRTVTYTYVKARRSQAAGAPMLGVPASRATSSQMSLAFRPDLAYPLA